MKRCHTMHRCRGVRLIVGTRRIRADNEIVPFTTHRDCIASMQGASVTACTRTIVLLLVGLAAIGAVCIEGELELVGAHTSCHAQVASGARLSGEAGKRSQELAIVRPATSGGVVKANAGGRTPACKLALILCCICKARGTLARACAL